MQRFSYRATVSDELPIEISEAQKFLNLLPRVAVTHCDITKIQRSTAHKKEHHHQPAATEKEKKGIYNGND